MRTRRHRGLRLPKSPTKQLKGRAGQALAEFAVVLPVLLLIVFGIIEFSLAFRTFQVVTNSAREGARVAVVPSTTSADVEDAVRARLLRAGLNADNENFSLVLRCNEVEGDICTQAGDRTEVEVGFPYRFLILGPIATLVCQGDCGNAFGEIQLRTASSMRTE